MRCPARPVDGRGEEVFVGSRSDSDRAAIRELVLDLAVVEEHLRDLASRDAGNEVIAFLDAEVELRSSERHILAALREHGLDFQAISTGVDGGSTVTSSPPAARGTSLASGVGDPLTASDSDLVRSLTDMIAHSGFPCLGARSVFRRDLATVRVYENLAGETGTSALLQDLTRFAQSVDVDGGFVSFVAIFRGPELQDERAFEDLLWKQLRMLRDADASEWSADVSADATNEHFGFSLAGTAFFVVGLHPRSSREARRTVSPTLVFNLHEQFEALRVSGRFTRMRDLIRDRDRLLQGTVNPMVGDHGTGTEARQYSGRAVGTHWVAPFDEGA